MRRRLPVFLTLAAAVFAAVIAAVACTTPDVSPAPLKTRADDAGKKKDSGSRGDNETPEEDPPLPDGAPPPGVVYGHTADTLYLFEPIGKTLEKKGSFACLDPEEPADRMLDIALDQNSVMYGTSDRGLLRINPIDGSCSYVNKQTGYPNSLSFVPMGTADQGKEALVGYQFDAPGPAGSATNYVQIDTATGAITPLGNLNDPSAAIKYKASGDLIALIRNGNKAYLTVKTIDDAGAGTDFLAEIDPANGRIKTIIGDIKKPNLYGLGFWAGTGYGFSSTGELLEIDMTTATSKTLLTLEEDGGLLEWFGAGVKTFAPTAPTPSQ